jgi:hypothetical protein
MQKTITVIDGKVASDIYGSWEDCDPGLYLGDTRVETIFNRYHKKTIRVTIEVIDPLTSQEAS